MKRIGHGGASALVRANTIESFEAAVELGIDMIEFDVRAHRGDLLLAHTRLDAHLGQTLSLDEALAHLRHPRFRDVELNLDLKSPACEHEVADALRRYGLRDRTLVSSQIPSLLDRFRSHDLLVATGISVGGRVSRLWQRWGDWRAAILGALAERRFGALMAQHALVDAELLAAVQERGAALYAWTVNDQRTIGRLSGLGVDGVVTSDPRLFAG